MGNLTIDTARVLDINPLPYLVAEAKIINIGLLMTPLASASNILIYTSIPMANFRFYGTYLLPLLVFLLPLMIFVLFTYFQGLETPKAARRNFLMDFQEWSLVPSKKVFYESIFLLVGLLASFDLLPAISPVIHQKLWIIAVVFMFIALLLPGIEPRRILKRTDWGTLFFLLGVFIMVFGLQKEGFLIMRQEIIQQFIQANMLVSILIIFWLACLFSALFGNIAVTYAFLPNIVFVINSPTIETYTPFFLSALIIGVNIGSNLTPTAGSSSILSTTLTQRSEQEFHTKELVKIGVITTFIPGILASLYLTSAFMLIHIFAVSLVGVHFLFIGLSGLEILFLYYKTTALNKLKQLTTKLTSHLR